MSFTNLNCLTAIPRCRKSCLKDHRKFKIVLLPSFLPSKGNGESVVRVTNAQTHELRLRGTREFTAQGEMQEKR